MCLGTLLTAAGAGAVQTTIGGRPVDLDATLGVREVFEEDRASTHERTLEQLTVRAAASFTDWLRFDSTTIGTNGGPTLKSDRAGVYSLDDAFQDISPAVEFDEAYLAVFLPAVDLKIGKQKVAWGKLDRSQPNDLINPQSYLDPFLQEEEQRKIGVPALQATYYLPATLGAPPESRVTAVWVPAYVPYRFPLATCQISGRQSHCDLERWFPPVGVPPPTITIPGSILPGGQVVTVPLSFRTDNTPTPAVRLDNSEIGLRYAANVHGADCALYYYHGFDVQPAFRFTADAVGSRDLTTLTGATTLSPAYRSIDAGGADFSYTFDRISVRGEGAFVDGRPFPIDLSFLISDPTQLRNSFLEALAKLPPTGSGTAPVKLPDSFAVRNAVDWGLGADYLYEGYLLLLQVQQTDVLHNDRRLLIKDVDTRLLLNLRKSFLQDTVQTQLVGEHAIESDYTLVRPLLRYRVTDHIAATAGYLFIAGRFASVIGQYKHNDEGWLNLEYRL